MQQRWEDSRNHFQLFGAQSYRIDLRYIIVYIQSETIISVTGQSWDLSPELFLHCLSYWLLMVSCYLEGIMDEKLGAFWQFCCLYFQCWNCSPFSAD